MVDISNIPSLTEEEKNSIENIASLTDEEKIYLKSNPLKQFGMNILKGAGHELASIPYGIAGKKNPVPEGEGLGGFIGKVGGYGIEGALTAAILAAALPEAAIGGLAALGGRGLAGMAARGAAKWGAGGAAHGYITNPEDRLTGALIEGSLGAAGAGAAPYFGAGISKLGGAAKDIAAYPFRALKLSKLNKALPEAEQSLENSLLESVGEMSEAGGGDKISRMLPKDKNKAIEQLEEKLGESKARAGDTIRRERGIRTMEAESLYDNLINKVGGEKISYPANYASKLNKQISRDALDNNFTKELIESITGKKDIASLIRAKQALNKKISPLFKSKAKDSLSPEKEILMNKYVKLRDTVDDILELNLKNKSTSANNYYDELMAANKYYAKEITPYKNNPEIAKLTSLKERVQIPEDLLTKLAEPNADNLKILSDLGDAGLQDIYLNYLSHGLRGLKPSGFLKRAGDIREMGMDKFTPKNVASNVSKVQKNYDAAEALRNAILDLERKQNAVPGISFARRILNRNIPHY